MGQDLGSTRPCQGLLFWTALQLCMIDSRLWTAHHCSGRQEANSHHSPLGLSLRTGDNTQNADTYRNQHSRTRFGYIANQDVANGRAIWQKVKTRLIG